MDTAVATEGFDHFVHGVFAMGLDRLGVPFLLLGASAEVLLHNEPAEAILANGSHLARQQTGELVCASPQSQRLILDFLAGGSGAAAAIDTVIYGAPGVAPLFVSLSWFQPPTFNGRVLAPVAVVVIRQGNAEEAMAAATMLFGFSRAEAAIVRAVADGQSPAAHATARGVSQHTVRKQLNAAMRKAGVRSQGELQDRLRELMRGPHLKKRA